jgi:GDP-6-deoxy-D-talose 4-dehydrogenase
MKTVMITGISGFTGRYIAQQFREAGYCVVGIENHGYDGDAIVCDLTDKSAIQKVFDQVKPDGVIHLAALSFVGQGNASAFYKVNTVGTFNLLEVMDQVGLNLEKVVIASSANVYGNPDVEIIDENTLPNPVNHYAASKMAMEYMVKIWFSRFPIIITRPFNYTGIGQDERFLVPKIVSHYRQKKAMIELGNTDVARDFSDVRDIAMCYLKLFESKISSVVINLCSGKATKLSEIITFMNKIAGYEIEVVVNPALVRKSEIKILCGSNDELKTKIDFSPVIPLTKTLTDMYYS